MRRLTAEKGRGRVLVFAPTEQGAAAALVRRMLPGATRGDFGLDGCTLAAIVVDEVHLWAQWSHFNEAMGHGIADVACTAAPVLFLTATLPPATVDWHLGALQLRRSDVMFVRQSVVGRRGVSLNIAIMGCESEMLDWSRDCTARFSETGGTQKLVVFCATTALAVTLQGKLESLSAGPDVRLFHGRLSDEKKVSVLDWFRSDGRVLLATCAFSVGVDVSNITRIVILGLPNSMSELFQELGRGARSERDEVVVDLLFCEAREMDVLGMKMERRRTSYMEGVHRAAEDFQTMVDWARRGGECRFATPARVLDDRIYCCISDEGIAQCDYCQLVCRQREMRDGQDVSMSSDIAAPATLSPYRPSSHGLTPPSSRASQLAPHMPTRTTPEEGTTRDDYAQEETLGDDAVDNVRSTHDILARADSRSKRVGLPLCMLALQAGLSRLRA